MADSGLASEPATVEVFHDQAVDRAARQAGSSQDLHDCRIYRIPRRSRIRRRRVRLKQVQGQTCPIASILNQSKSRGREACKIERIHQPAVCPITAPPATTIATHTAQNSMVRSYTHGMTYTLVGAIHDYVNRLNDDTHFAVTHGELVETMRGCSRPRGSASTTSTTASSRSYPSSSRTPRRPRDCP